jgi:AcrR family transcriptional regulator
VAKRNRPPENNSIDVQVLVSLLADEDNTVDTRVLEAAIDLIGEHGERAVTMTDIGEQSGVARATIFRRFGSKQAVIDRALLWELRKFVVDLITATAQCTTKVDVLAEVLVRAVAFSHHNPIIRRLIESEPERLVNFARSPKLAPLALARALITGLVKRFDTPTATAADNEHIADVIAHLAIAYALVPESSMTLTNDAQLRSTIKKIISGV